MSSEEILVEVKDLKKCYEIYDSPKDRLKQLVLPSFFGLLQRVVRWLSPDGTIRLPKYYREFWALDGVTFQIRRGETFGIIGKNGSGKSTLLQILAGTLTPSSGQVKVNGRVAALLELGSGFNPEFTGKENIFLNARILGLSQKEILDKYDQIVEFADIGEFIDQPVKTYSSGMFVRLAFAVQAHIDASIVIIDEALAVGDIYFRQKCYARLEKLKESGVAVLLVSHAMSEIEQFCAKAVLLDKGKQLFLGQSYIATKHYYLLNQNEILGPVTKKIPDINLTNSYENLGRSIASQTFVNIENKTQVSNGKAKCLQVLITDINGEPKNIFRQGEVALFHYEFYVNEYIGVPICGVSITNDKGTIVHGKNNWQTSSNDFVEELYHGHVLCRQEIKLDLAPGEYVYQVGLAGVSKENWVNKENISFEAEPEYLTRICHVPQVGEFSVILASKNGRNHLTHHGVANLDGKIHCSVTPLDDID